MKSRLLLTVLTTAMLGGLSGCIAIPILGGDQEVSFSHETLWAIPGPAHITLERLIAGGEIRSLRQQTIDGRVIYHVEATVDEQDREYDIADDGTVLSSGKGMAYTALPGGVLAAVRKYSGSVARLRVCREAEGGQAFYKIKGKGKGGAVMTLKLTDAGRIIAKEKS